MQRVIAALLIICLFPLFFLIAIFVYLFLGKPFLFLHARPGLHGNIFNVYKFRTMKSSLNSDGVLLSDSERMTRFGRFLRSTSLDELPELFNIARGEMGFVGPRPLLVQYLPLYTPEQAKRHDVLPGITGWAQVNGRNAISWEKKFALDVWYVDNRSFWLDCRILLMTVMIAIKREGISADGDATMPIFTGNRIE